MHTPPKQPVSTMKQLMKQNYWLFFPYVLYIVYNEPDYIIQVPLPSRKGALAPLCFHRTDGTTVFTKRNLKWISASTKKKMGKSKNSAQCWFCGSPHRSNAHTEWQQEEGPPALPEAPSLTPTTLSPSASSHQSPERCL